MRRWIVRAGEGTSVGAIVKLAAADDARAIEEGRVFVGRRRARAAGDPVAVGDEVTIAQAVGGAGDVAVVLARDEREGKWVAVDKPAGLPTIPDQGGASHALIALAARAIHAPVARLHATSRLDRDVSGVVVFTLDNATAERLQAARAEHRYVRRYVAIASRAPGSDAGTWDAPIGRAKDPRHRAVDGRDPIEARTHFAIVARTASGAALLALAPVTGRTHQLRVHAGDARAPLLGDRVYGGPTRLTLPSGRVLALDRIALHAARITLPAEMTPAPIDSPIPAALRDTWLALGGDDAAWDKAVSCPLEAK